MEICLRLLLQKYIVFRKLPLLPSSGENVQPNILGTLGKAGPSHRILYPYLMSKGVSYCILFVLNNLSHCSFLKLPLSICDITPFSPHNTYQSASTRDVSDLFELTLVCHSILLLVEASMVRFIHWTAFAQIRHKLYTFVFPTLLYRLLSDTKCRKIQVQKLDGYTDSWTKGRQIHSTESSQIHSGNVTELQRDEIHRENAVSFA